MSIMNVDAVRMIAGQNAIQAVEVARFHQRRIPDDLENALRWREAAHAVVNRHDLDLGVRMPEGDDLAAVIEAEAHRVLIAEKSVQIARAHVTSAEITVSGLSAREARENWIPAACDEFRAAADELLSIINDAPSVLHGHESKVDVAAFVRRNELLDRINALSSERRIYAVALDERRDLPAVAAFWLNCLPPTEEDLERIRQRWGAQLGIARLADMVNALADPIGTVHHELGAREGNLALMSVLTLDLCPAGGLAQRYRDWEAIAPARPQMTGQGSDVATADALAAYKSARSDLYRERAQLRQPAEAKAKAKA